MSGSKLAAGTGARNGPTIDSMFGLPPEIWQLLLSGPGRPNWGPGSGEHAMYPTPNLSNPWRMVGGGKTGMSGHQGQVGGNFSGLPFFPNRQGGANGFSTGMLTPATGPLGSMGQQRPYESGATPMGLQHILGGLRNMLLNYPGYSGSFTGSGGRMMGNR